MVAFIPALLIGTGAVTGLGGAASAARGAVLIKRARRRARIAAGGYEIELEHTNAVIAQTNECVQGFGSHQKDALTAVVHRMADFLRRHERAVTERASELLDGIVVDTKKLEAFTGGKVTVEGLAAQVASAAAAGVATHTALPLAVSTYGTASTGTAIARLGGAAAQKATLAYLGGGSLASGGGGMALGAVALNFVTIGPSILITGLIFAGKGQKALTEADKYAADVAASIGQQQKLRNRLALVGRRVDELEQLLANLVSRSSAALDELECRDDFDPDRDGTLFQRAIAYAVAVRDVVSTPILDGHGELEPDTGRLILRYREML